MTLPAACYHLIVAGRLSRLLMDTIDDRFGAAASTRPSGGDTVVVLAADQASLRALLTLLWDVGHELRVVSACTRDPDRGTRPPPASTCRQEADQGTSCASRRRAD
jgi:hypothetical protein